VYVEKITIKNLRVFKEATLSLRFPEDVSSSGRMKLYCPNVNLILGDNGAGKSSILKAIALAALGPLGQKFPPYRLVRELRSSRRLPTAKRNQVARTATLRGRALINALFQRTWQDVGLQKPRSIRRPITSRVEIRRVRDEEFIHLAPGKHRADWERMFDNKSPAFLTVGYGATRRVDTDPSAASPQQKLRQMPLRQQRVQSLFFEGYTLVPLAHWLPELQHTNKGRFTQVVARLNDVLPDGYEFAGKTDRSGDYLFCQHKNLVPFPALSDGCRAFVGWVADLLYHINLGCPSGVKLVDNAGIVLVDEIDLHLHPEWQRTVIPTLSATFPRLQFIFTSHSPIVVGSLQRDNLWVCTMDEITGESTAEQKETGVHGLNSDQILLTEYFGLKSSRAPRKERQLDEIAAAAERRTPHKAQEFLQSLVTALEDHSENNK
jgi:predicted ATPase